MALAFAGAKRHSSSTPLLKDTKNTTSMVPRRCEQLRGDPLFHYTAPQKIACTISTPVECTESGLLLLLLLRVGMERFLPSAGGSSAAGLKPCGEPTCCIRSRNATTKRCLKPTTQGDLKAATTAAVLHYVHTIV